jgi:energy-coupling factor transporter transmembrane protein EcfT
VAVAARLGLARLAGALKPVACFMALIFLLHLLMTDGTPLISLAPLPLQITREGILQGGFVTWQFASLVIAAAILTLTTSPSDLVGGIERLLRPFRRLGVPVGEIAMMVSLALRFLPMMHGEYRRLRMAQMARGADFTTGGIVLRSRAVAALAVPLLLSALRCADELALAMEARGYHRGARSSLREFRLTRRDRLAFLLLAVFALFNFGLGG